MTFSDFMNGIENFIKEYIFKQFAHITWVDIVDILVLTVLLYGVYKFIRDRRAGKLAMGVLIIIAMLILTSVLHMKAVNYILQNFYQVGIIVIVIVFQPELRAALEKMGASPLSGIRTISGETRDMAVITEAVDNICEAVCDLSRSRTGALIVIERSTKLGEYIKSGVVINAKTSSYLLRNIFFNKAPLHDGAVIIRDLHIYAAGCFLPLSTQEDIIKDLGTRHRAAIGMSEESDAPVIVVSEENGVISMALNGNLKRDYNYNSLKQELLKLLTPGSQQIAHTKNTKSKE